jgi:hypothetical protein
MLDLGEAVSEPEEAEAPDEELVESEAAVASDFDSFADLAFDSALPMAERRAALKEAIMSCMGGGYEEEDSASSAKSELASIFGG